VSWITARRRHPAAGYAVVLLGLIAIGIVYGAVTAPGRPAAATAPAATPQDIAQGQALFA
jgi:ubiquinol-cytochrome c reductase cytochrome c subunit